VIYNRIKFEEQSQSLGTPLLSKWVQYNRNTHTSYFTDKTDETSIKKGADIVHKDSTKIAGIVAGIVVAAIILVVICYRRNKRKVRGKTYDNLWY